MLNAIIIEDEKPGAEVLVKTLSQVAEVNIKATLNSVKESIEYITSHPEADIIFSEVQLCDGLSFAIFDQTGFQIPVIYITGYDHYTMMAFENNGIDYLLKPVNKADLDRALLKYNKLQTHFSHTIANATTAKPERLINEGKKTRLLVKKGLDNIALRFEDIVLIYTQNKLVYVIDRSSKKYISEKNLRDLEEELDNTIFFRVNRQYIVNINYVKSFKPHKKAKLLINITIPEINHSIVISRETAPAFRKWIYA